MSEQIDPAEVAEEEMIGPEPAAEPAAEQTAGSGRGLFEMLFRTEAPPEVNPQSLEMDYGVSKGKALILFGLMKAAGSGGMPAIGDITLGGFLEFQELQSSGGDRAEATEIETLEEEPGTDQAREGRDAE